MLTSFLRPLFDPFTLLLMLLVLLATVWPASGQGAVWVGGVTSAAISLLFFLHGARLSRQALWQGLTHWRLHGWILGCTFIGFPLLVLLGQPLLRPWLGDGLWQGLLYLAVLPGTVQSAIAFTAIARGNLAAAICSASASSFIGLLLTPLLVQLLLNTQGSSFPFWPAVGGISLQLLLPFMLGHLLRPWIGHWVASQQRWLKWVDQGSILLVVYSAFSVAVVAGLWQSVSLMQLLSLIGLCCLLLTFVLLGTRWIARAQGFSREDEITLVFCASKKSLATGAPMAPFIFVGAAAGPVLLPLMIYHQIQLVVCAYLAQDYAQRPIKHDNAALSPTGEKN
ncbi:bile acid:sodium symporter family protein [Marinospirillum sp. MEB164]|uniref:Bile acid:sodium symporter family protein n=1 Tax=Marinospirillum alkalitolerans TaxID=3123374 RepID=A0ABW8PXJ7_9GAMM